MSDRPQPQDGEGVQDGAAHGGGRRASRAQPPPPSMRTMLLMKRKLSTWKAAGQASAAGGGAPSTAASKSLAPPVRYEPTYHQEPHEKFSARRAEETMLAACKFFLASQPGYNAAKCASISRLLVDDIKQRLKQQHGEHFPRYKLVVQVIISHKQQQELHVASQCVWDARYDQVVTVTYEIKDILATAIVHAVYCE